MDPWEHRIDLAIRGWRTEIRLTRTGIESASAGTVAFGVWATTMYWHGHISDVCLHDHETLDLAEPEATRKMAHRIGIVHEACLRATRDFTDCLPCLGNRNADGTLGLVRNGWATDRMGHSDPQFEPTEALPPQATGLGDGGRHLEAMRRAACAGLHLEDSVNPWFGRSRYPHDCKDRDWGYRLRVAVRRSAGQSVSFRPQEFTTRVLHESVVAPLIDAASASLLELFADHAPGGRKSCLTGNGLPPGFQTLLEWKAEQEQRQNAMGVKPEAC